MIKNRYLPILNNKPWWLSGGISAANCIAAYQAKGAASYAASKVNLANVSTYPLTASTYELDWDANTGWAFSLTAGKNLNTGINTNTTGLLTMVMRVANLISNGQVMICAALASTYYGLRKSNVTPYALYYAQTDVVTYGSNPITFTAGIDKSGYCYFDGSHEATISSPATRNANIFIGARQASEGAFGAGNMLALAFYNETLTEAQHAALHTAMNAL